MAYETTAEAKARRAAVPLQNERLLKRYMERRAATVGRRREPDLAIVPRRVTQVERRPMGADEMNAWAAELQAAGALARERFRAVQGAYEAVESAHERGDYSPSPDFQQRLDQFRSAASEVHRLAAEFRSPT